MRKTTFCIGLFVQAIKNKSAKNFFFSLSEVHKSIAKRIERYDENIEQDSSRYEHDYSNDICADYIINKISSEVTSNSLIVIDYLQLLDQKRTNDTLQNQVIALKKFAKEKGCIIIFISQIDREVENRLDPRPIFGDILLPNPLDLGLMNKILLLYIDLNKLEEADIIFCKPKLHKFTYPIKKGEIKFI
jgi:replicative DNA helicase